MKTLKLLFSLIFIAAFASVGFGQITGSAHDLSGEAWNTTTEICIVCHTPHNGSGAVGAVLWNHAETVATFTVYASTTLDATVGQPSGTSKLCLSCHDGTVGLEDFGGAGGTTYISGDALVGTDLGNDHPISFTYDAALSGADVGLHDPTTQPSGLGSTITADLLFGESLECASCHDVHNNGLGSDYLLRLDNAASALCLTCHDK